MKKKIGIKLFGGLQIPIGDAQWQLLEQYVGKGIGKKQQEFLTYLILNSKRKITSAELIERFWPDTGKDPANSLKNMMHKTRALLHVVFPEKEELITTQPGGYEWNSSVEIELDVNLFEHYYHESKQFKADNSLDLKTKAAELYTGSILPGNSADWLEPLNIYYRTVYIDLCKALVKELLDKERWDDVIRLCSQAYILEPEVEEFTFCYMHAMIAVGLSGQAIRHYEDYKSMLWDEFNLVPSAAVEQAYTIASYNLNNAEDVENRIVKQLTTPVEQFEAFRCDMMVFQNIVQLELRHIARSKNPSTLVILQTEMRGGELNATDIRRMERVILQKLRAGDPFTRLNMGSFALLLSGATEENAEKVMERLQRAFCTAYPRSKAYFRYRLYPLLNSEN